MNASAVVARRWYADMIADRSQAYLDVCEWYVGPSLKTPTPELERRPLPVALFGARTRKEFVRIFVHERAKMACLYSMLLATSGGRWTGRQSLRGQTA